MRTMVSIAAAAAVVALQMPAHVASGEGRRGRASIANSLVSVAHGGFEVSVEISLPRSNSVMFTGWTRDETGTRLSTVDNLGCALTHRWYVVNSDAAGRPGVFAFSRIGLADLSGRDSAVVGPPLTAEGTAVDAITGGGARIGRYVFFEGWLGAGVRRTEVEARCCDGEIWREAKTRAHFRGDVSLGVQF